MCSCLVHQRNVLGMQREAYLESQCRATFLACSEEFAEHCEHITCPQDCLEPNIKGLIHVMYLYVKNVMSLGVQVTRQQHIPA